MSDVTVSILAADALAPLSARVSASTVMVKFRL